MRPLPLALLAPIIGCGWLLFPSSLRAQDEGIFAEIQTNHGVIRAQLAFDKAPLTVANFVGLAEGSQSAVNLPEGRLIESDFYADNRFHRVIKDFMIQGGSPTGGSVGGPGYRFRDEFHPELTHDEPFVLSMANSGPHTNGSQFFITVAPTPELNNVHAVFGKVVAGQEVVTAISLTPTDAQDRPVDPVIIESIAIERVGSAAQSFPSEEISLPQVRLAPALWDHHQGKRQLRVPTRDFAEYSLLISEDLQSWTSQPLGSPGPPALYVDVTELMQGKAQRFFRVVEVVFPEIVYSPDTLKGKRLSTVVTRFGESRTNASLTYDFSTGAAGSAQLTDRQPVSFNNSFYRVDSFHTATLVVRTPGPGPTLPPPFDWAQLALTFVSHTTGTFTGILPTHFPAPVTISGSFTLHDS